MLGELFFCVLFSLLCLSGVDLHSRPNFLLLLYIELFSCLSSCACLNWKRRNWRVRSRIKGVWDGECGPPPLWRHEFPRDGWQELVWSYLEHQFSSVAQSHSTLCNPMDCSMPGFPVHHQLPELAQIHVHRVSDAIQPSWAYLSIQSIQLSWA